MAAASNPAPGRSSPSRPGNERFRGTPPSTSQTPVRAREINSPTVDDSADARSSPEASLNSSKHILPALKGDVARHGLATATTSPHGPTEALSTPTRSSPAARLASSQDEEEEMEVMVPNAVKVTSKPVNKLSVRQLADPSPTLESPKAFDLPWPCGQANASSPKHSTIVATSQSASTLASHSPNMPENEPLRRRRRRMEAPSFSQITPEPALTSRGLSAGQLRPALQQSPTSTAEALLGNTPELTQISSDKREDSPCKRSSFASEASPSLKKQQLCVSGEGSSADASTLPQSQRHPASGAPPSLTASGSDKVIKEMAPFDMFRQAYPQYADSLDNFVRAAICLRFMQSQNLLSEYLYDDFIRVFSGSYVDYVDSCANPLPAHQWYNSIGGKPAFDKMVITRETLSRVFEVYTDVAREANDSIGSSLASPLKQGRSEDGHDIETPYRESSNHNVRESQQHKSSAATPTQTSTPSSESPRSTQVVWRTPSNPASGVAKLLNGERGLRGDPRFQKTNPLWNLRDHNPLPSLDSLQRLATAARQVRLH
ncbi:unnamed protein product [Parascedosporium putredinis]|uniref:Uncharacterized protein n=1 Tax=Parascedosporium putredinis TaxID=1442378 RepID=A0A9P1MFL5_9PEZI|nr:unnamed protein product [Parascedosporium putredinis]CAI8002595.1 unnamed protein product [Parascedosporium putredinis]